MVGRSSADVKTRISHIELTTILLLLSLVSVQTRGFNAREQLRSAPTLSRQILGHLAAMFKKHRAMDDSEMLTVAPNRVWRRVIWVIGTYVD